MTETTNTATEAVETMSPARAARKGAQRSVRNIADLTGKLQYMIEGRSGLTAQAKADALYEALAVAEALAEAAKEAAVFLGTATLYAQGVLPVPTAEADTEAEGASLTD